MRLKSVRTILLVIVNLLLLSILFIGYRKIQTIRENKAYQDQFSKVVQLEGDTEKGKKAQVQEGIIGTSYVTAYFPTKDGQPITVIKDKISEDLKRLGSDEKTKKPEHLTFYHSEEIEAPFVGYHPIQIKRAEYQYKKGQFIKDETVKLPLFYLDDEDNPLTLSEVFADPDGAKQIFLDELKNNLTFRQLDETSIDQMVAHFSEMDLSQWTFQYEKGNFIISFPSKVKGDDTFKVPLSKFYDVINTDRLLPADLESYQSYIEERRQKMIALTFDDGPDPKTTPQALSILKKYNAKATFFMVGKNVDAYPNIAKQVRKEGHQIGNHTWDHPQLPKLSLSDAKKEILDTQEAIQKATGVQTKITRPPYGAINNAIQYGIDQSFIMWDVDSLDWKNHNTASILNEVKKEVKPGSIILMHDVHQTTIDALPTVLDYLKEQGYTFVTVDELLNYQLESHRIYYNRN